MAVESPHLYNVMFTMSWSSFEPDAADRKLAAGTCRCWSTPWPGRSTPACSTATNDLALEFWSFNHGVSRSGSPACSAPEVVRRRLANGGRTLRRGHAPVTAPS